MAIKPQNQEREERLETQSLKTMEVSKHNNKTVIVCRDSCHGMSNEFHTSSISSYSSSSSSSSSSGVDDIIALHYYTLDEIQGHNTEASAWIVAGDNIYDVTEYIKHHPGGKYSVMKKIGGVVDCTQDLMFHGKSGQKQWNKYLVGKITKFPSKNGQQVEKEWWKFW